MDHRSSRRARRHSWYGAKRYTKRVLSMRVPHAVVRACVRLRPQLRRDGRLPAPASLAQVTGTALGESFVMLRPDRCIVAKELYWGEGVRPRAEDALAIDVFARLARTAGDDAVAIDIGAYTGIFSIMAATVNPNLHALAFEIVPDVYEALLENVRANGLTDRVTAALAGVGSPGATMLVPAASDGSALPDFFSADTHFEDGVQIDFRSLDDITDRIATGAGVVMKIDVEGTEDAVLAYGQRFLASHHPDIVCELLFQRANAEAVWSALSPNGYRAYLFTARGLAQPGGSDPSVPPKPNPRWRDWLFTTRSAQELTALGIPVLPEMARGSSSG